MGCISSQGRESTHTSPTVLDIDYYSAAVDNEHIFFDRELDDLLTALKEQYDYIQKNNKYINRRDLYTWMKTEMDYTLWGEGCLRVYLGIRGTMRKWNRKNYTRRGHLKKYAKVEDLGGLLSYVCM